MANVLFKRGLQNNIPRDGQAQDGVFYLTTDTNRLYIGNKDNNPVLLNQTVNFAASLADLQSISDSWTDKAAHVKDLYYVMHNDDGAGNILAVWTQTETNKYGWVQINPDHNTYVNEFFASMASGTNAATMTLGLGYNSADEESQTISFSVAGTGKTIDIKAAPTGYGFVLTGDTYTLSSDDATISLTSALGQAASSVKLVGGDNVTVVDGDNDNEIKISAVDTVINNMAVEVDENGKIFVKLFDNQNGDVSASTGNIVMTYGQGGTKQAPIGGVLDVYSKDDVDNKLKDLNGLTYRGTIGGTGATYDMGADYKVYAKGSSTALPVHNGDMFLVSGEAKYDKDNTAYTGDLLIATGTETDGVLTSITWTYVPSGDDAKLDTTYQFVADQLNNALSIQANSSLDGPMGEVGNIKFQAPKADGAIAITSEASGTNNSNLLIKVTHAEYDAQEKTGAALNQNENEEVDVLTGIETNAEGHVTGYVVSKLQAPRYALSDSPMLDSLTIGNNIGVTVKQALHLKNGDNEVQKVGFNILSESLAISTDKDDDIQIDFAWGTF